MLLDAPDPLDFLRTPGILGDPKMSMNTSMSMKRNQTDRNRTDQNWTDRSQTDQSTRPTRTGPTRTGPTGTGPTRTGPTGTGPTGINWTDWNWTDQNRIDQNQTDQNRTDWNWTDRNQIARLHGPDQTRPEASHQGSRIMDLGPCFGMNGHSRRDPDVILRVPRSKNQFPIIFCMF